MIIRTSALAKCEAFSEDVWRRIHNTATKTGVIWMEVNSTQTLFRKITKQLARAAFRDWLRSDGFGSAKAGLRSASQKSGGA